MAEVEAVSRHLYEQRAELRRRDVRGRRRLTRQIALLSGLPGPSPDGGGEAGVREPRRPLQPHSGPGRALRLGS